MNTPQSWHREWLARILKLEISADQRLALVALLTLISSDGTCTHSHNSIAKTAGLKRRTSMRAVEAAESAGLLTRTERGTGQTKIIKITQIHPEGSVWPDTRYIRPVPTQTQGGVHTDTRYIDPVPTQTQGGVWPDTGGVSAQAQGCVQPDTQTVVSSLVVLEDLQERESEPPQLQKNTPQNVGGGGSRSRTYKWNLKPIIEIWNRLVDETPPDTAQLAALGEDVARTALFHTLRATNIKSTRLGYFFGTARRIQQQQTARTYTDQEITDGLEADEIDGETERLMRLLGG